MSAHALPAAWHLLAGSVDLVDAVARAENNNNLDLWAENM